MTARGFKLSSLTSKNQARLIISKDRNNVFFCLNQRLHCVYLVSYVICSTLYERSVVGISYQRFPKFIIFIFPTYFTSKLRTAKLLQLH